MLNFNLVRRFVLSLGLVFAAALIGGCGGTGENSVIEGQLTPEQEAEADNVMMPGDPGEGGATAPAAPQ